MKYYAKINNQKVSLSSLEDYDSRAEIAKAYGDQVISFPGGPPLVHINMIYAEANSFGFFSILAGLAFGALCYRLIGAGLGAALGLLIEYNVNRAEKQIASQFNKTVFPTPLDTVDFTKAKFYVELLHQLSQEYGIENGTRIKQGNMNISLPLVNVNFQSPNYDLIVLDSDNRLHYFKKYGNYDGWSMATSFHLN